MRLSMTEKVLLGLAMFVVAFCGGFIAALHNHSHDGPVCTSETEDSVIEDCDYRNGGWYAE